jgi:hypothetical protein
MESCFPEGRHQLQFEFVRSCGRRGRCSRALRQRFFLFWIGHRRAAHAHGQETSYCRDPRPLDNDYYFGRTILAAVFAEEGMLDFRDLICPQGGRASAHGALSSSNSRIARDSDSRHSASALAPVRNLPTRLSSCSPGIGQEPGLTASFQPPYNSTVS